MAQIKAGDSFTYYHPKYPRTKNGKVMIAEVVTSAYIEPKSRDLVIRQYPIQYCTKVEELEDYNI
jgi:hypothetical protein